MCGFYHTCVIFTTHVRSGWHGWTRHEYWFWLCSFASFSCAPDRPCGDECDWLEKTMEGIVRHDLGEVDVCSWGCSYGCSWRCIWCWSLSQWARWCPWHRNWSLGRWHWGTRGRQFWQDRIRHLLSSNFPPNILRSKKFRNLGSDTLSTGNSDSNLSNKKIKL